MHHTHTYRAVNPIPRNDVGQTGEGFPPHCDETKGYRCQGMTDGSGADPTLEIVDRVVIPATLPAGSYVLGWRWDCEESNREFMFVACICVSLFDGVCYLCPAEIWQSCSDVTITN
jgi:hypothetical protein